MTKRRSSTAPTYNYNKTFEEWVGAGAFANIPEGAEIGVEVEVEGINLPRTGLTGWTAIEDGSLRGESAEYVFRGPATRTEMVARLETFGKKMKDVQINESYRTSVHVHLNARNMQIKNILNQILLYTIFEDVFGEFCGSERIGNLFCLRAKDAEYYLEELLNVVRNDNLAHLDTDNLRYLACNARALFRHGTLEFRAFRGTVDTDLIRTWVEILLALKDAANEKFQNPLEIVQDFSSRGPNDFAARIFSEEQIGLFNQDWQDKLIGNVRLIQHIAHASSWEPTPEKKTIQPKAPTYGSYVRTNIIWQDDHRERAFVLDQNLLAVPAIEAENNIPVQFDDEDEI